MWRKKLHLIGTSAAILIFIMAILPLSLSAAELEIESIQNETPRIPLIGDDAPAFSAVTTQGNISFPADYKGKWVILFSHPADFTPVCTTEFMTFATLMPKFNKLNCELIGLSIDSNYSHIAWLRTIKEKKRGTKTNRRIKMKA